jgi:hypothetical protein
MQCLEEVCSQLRLWSRNLGIPWRRFTPPVRTDTHRPFPAFTFIGRSIDVGPEEGSGGEEAPEEGHDGSVLEGGEGLPPRAPQICSLLFLVGCFFCKPTCGRAEHVFVTTPLFEEPTNFVDSNRLAFWAGTQRLICRLGRKQCLFVCRFHGCCCLGRRCGIYSEELVYMFADSLCVSDETAPTPTPLELGPLRWS